MFGVKSISLDTQQIARIDSPPSCVIIMTSATACIIKCIEVFISIEMMGATEKILPKEKDNQQKKKREISSYRRLHSVVCIVVYYSSSLKRSLQRK